MQLLRCWLEPRKEITLSQYWLLYNDSVIFRVDFKILLLSGHGFLEPVPSLDLGGRHSDISLKFDLKPCFFSYSLRLRWTQKCYVMLLYAHTAGCFHHALAHLPLSLFRFLSLWNLSTQPYHINVHITAGPCLVFFNLNDQVTQSSLWG